MKNVSSTSSRCRAIQFAAIAVLVVGTSLSSIVSANYFGGRHYYGGWNYYPTRTYYYSNYY